MIPRTCHCTETAHFTCHSHYLDLQPLIEHPLRPSPLFPSMRDLQVESMSTRDIFSLWEHKKQIPWKGAWKIYAIISPDVLLTVFVIETDGKLNEQQGGERRRVTTGDSYLQSKAANRGWFSHMKRKRDFPCAKGTGQTAIKRKSSLHPPTTTTIASCSHWLTFCRSQQRIFDQEPSRSSDS